MTRIREEEEEFTTGPRHKMDDCKLCWWGARLKVSSVCDDNQQATNTLAAPRFLLQSMQYSRAHFENR